MAVESPGCCDTQYELIRKILLSLVAIGSGVGSNLQSGSQAIASGADTVCVVFPVPFTSVPNVVVSLSRPAADPIMEVNIDEASITTTGFCVSLGGTTVDANYLLKWMAS